MNKREDVLSTLKIRRGGVEDWNTVRSWIRSMVRVEPGVMRRVARAEFGDLGNWIEAGSKNIKTACGCLVGTTALELVRARDNYTLESNTHPEFVHSKGKYKGESCTAADVVTALMREEIKQDADVAGMAAYWLGDILGQDTAIELFKDEIERALHTRRLRLRKRA